MKDNLAEIPMPNTGLALAGLPTPEHAAELNIDPIRIAFKEGIIKTADLLPNVVQRIHEASPHHGLTVNERVLRRNTLYRLAAVCLDAQLGEDFV